MPTKSNFMFNVPIVQFSIEGKRQDRMVNIGPTTGGISVNTRYRKLSQVTMQLIFDCLVENPLLIPGQFYTVQVIHPPDYEGNQKVERMTAELIEYTRRTRAKDVQMTEYHFEYNQKDVTDSIDEEETALLPQYIKGPLEIKAEKNAQFESETGIPTIDSDFTPKFVMDAIESQKEKKEFHNCDGVIEANSPYNAEERWAKPSPVNFTLNAPSLDTLINPVAQSEMLKMIKMRRDDSDSYNYQIPEPKPRSTDRDELTVSTSPKMPESKDRPAWLCDTHQQDTRCDGNHVWPPKGMEDLGPNDFKFVADEEEEPRLAKFQIGGNTGPWPYVHASNQLVETTLQGHEQPDGSFELEITGHRALSPEETTKFMADQKARDLAIELKKIEAEKIFSDTVFQKAGFVGIKDGLIAIVEEQFEASKPAPDEMLDDFEVCATRAMDLKFSQLDPKPNIYTTGTPGIPIDAEAITAEEHRRIRAAQDFWFWPREKGEVY